MKNKNIWIIGASFGIGEDLAVSLSNNNNIVISARSTAKLEEVALKLNKNYNHIISTLDVISKESIISSYHDIIKKFGFIIKKLIKINK